MEKGVFGVYDRKVRTRGVRALLLETLWRMRDPNIFLNAPDAWGIRTNGRVSNWQDKDVGKITLPGMINRICYQMPVERGRDPNDVPPLPRRVPGGTDLTSRTEAKLFQALEAEFPVESRRIVSWNSIYDALEIYGHPGLMRLLKRAIALTPANLPDETRMPLGEVVMPGQILRN